MNFQLTADQIVKLDNWLDIQTANAIAKQKADPPNVPIELLEACWENGYPYSGAIGGSLTYSFTPTSLGVSVTVTDAHTKQSIDLSDYEDW